MKILVALESYSPNIGGVETLFKSICEGLVEQGHSVCVVTAAGPGQPSVEQVNGVTIRRLGPYNRYVYTLLAVFPLIRLAVHSDVVLTTSYNAALPAWIAATLNQKRVFVVFHEVWGRLWFRLPFFGRLQKTGHYLFEQLLLRLPFDRFIAVSNAMRERLIQNGVPAARVTLIYNGIDYEALDGHQHTPAGPFTCVYFGRLGISKGLDLLIPAMARLAESCPDCRLTLITPSTPKILFRRLQTLIQQHRIEARVTVLDHLPKEELFAVLTTAHCVVIPSYSEGFCFAAVEACGLGIPVVSSGQGALMEVVSGRCLTLTEMTPEALYQEMEHARRGEWDWKPVVRFPLDATVAAYHELLTKPENTTGALSAVVG